MDERETQERQRIRLLSASNRGPAKHLHNPYRVRLRLLVKCVYEHGMNTRIKGDSCHRHTQCDSHPLACNTMLNPNPPISIEMDPIQSRPAPYIYNVSNHQYVFRTSSSSVAMFDKSAKKSPRKSFQSSSSQSLLSRYPQWLPESDRNSFQEDLSTPNILIS